MESRVVAAKRGGRRGGEEWELGMADAHWYVYMAKQGPTAQHRNYIHCPAIKP